MTRSGRQRDRRRVQIVIKDYSICYVCKQEGLTESDKFCPNCGFPQRGEYNDQWRFIINQRKKKSSIREAKDLVARGRNILFLVAGFNVLSFIGTDNTTLAVGVIISLMYLGFGIWAAKKPFPALLTGLVVYVTINLFFGIFEPYFLVSGLLLKVAIVGTLAYAVYSSKESEKLEKEVF